MEDFLDPVAGYGAFAEQPGGAGRKFDNRRFAARAATADQHGIDRRTEAAYDLFGGNRGRVSRFDWRSAR